MIPVAKTEVFGPVHQVNSTLWMAVTGLIALGWTALILLHARRSVKQLQEQRARLDLAARYGGFGRADWGGHQPVGVYLVEESVIAGRLGSGAKARIRRDLEVRARAEAMKGRAFDAWRMN